MKGFYSENISYALWSEIQRIESNRDSILEFSEDETPIRTIPNITNDDIVEIATAIREYLGLDTPLRSKTAYGNNPFNYYRNIVERNGIIVAQVSTGAQSHAKFREIKKVSFFSLLFIDKKVIAW